MDETCRRKESETKSLRWKHLEDAADRYKRVGIDQALLQMSKLAYPSSPHLHHAEISKRSKLIIHGKHVKLHNRGDKGIKWDEDLRRKARAPCCPLMSFSVGSAAPVNVLCCDWIQDNNQQRTPAKPPSQCRCGQRSGKRDCCYGHISKWVTAVNPLNSGSTYSQRHRGGVTASMCFDQ